MKRIIVPTLLLGLSALAGAQDVAVSRIGSSGTDYNFYGSANGLTAYSIGTTSCNVGPVIILWNDNIGQAPVITTNMFRVDGEGRFSQLGYSWMKDSFCAVNENSCGSCQSTSCDTLGIGCADTYGAGLNDGASGVAKFRVNPATGEWPASWGSGPSGALPLRGRLQVPTAEIMDQDSRYFASSTYLSEHDQMAGNGLNNSSYQEFRFNSISNLQNQGPINMFEPPIYAWQEVHPDVHIDLLESTDEGGPGVHSWIYVGSKATDLGGGLWRYQYAIFNFNSGRAVGGFELDTSCLPSNFEFRGVDHHSGSPWANDPWVQSSNGNTVRWETSESFAQNSNANAIRWDTMYTYTFEVFAEPAANLGTASVEFFEPGAVNDLPADVIVPGPNCCAGGSLAAYCSANGNSVNPNGAIITFSGTPNVSSNNLEFFVTSLPSNQFGYFLMSASQGFVANFAGSDGNLCLGAPQYRFNTNILNSGLFGFAEFAVDNNNLPQGVQFTPGSSWNFQMWYRDGLSSNTTSGVAVTFCQ